MKRKKGGLNAESLLKIEKPISNDITDNLVSTRETSKFKTSKYSDLEDMRYALVYSSD